MDDETSGEKGRVRIMVQGRVQGVFYRVSTVEEAVRLGLKGWVRNCPDGSVEVLAEGQTRKLQDLIGWCHQGPLGAKVDAVHLQWESFTGEFEKFRIRR
jgi:acylphosphatase